MNWRARIGEGGEKFTQLFRFKGGASSGETGASGRSAPEIGVAREEAWRNSARKSMPPSSGWSSSPRNTRAGWATI